MAEKKETKLILPNEIPNINVAIVGDPKTLKSSLALTFPKDIAIFAFDKAGVIRALRHVRLHVDPEIDDKIQLFEYGVPLMKTAQDKFKWARERWTKFFEKDLPEAAESGAFKTIMIDTGTMMYDMCRMAYREEQGFEKVNQRNYEEIYARMSGVLMLPQYYEVNMVSTYYLKDEWKGGSSTGEEILDGYKKTGGLVDIVLQTKIKQEIIEGKLENIPVAVINECGYDYHLNGVELTNPTYDDIINLMFPEA